ncbi:MAG: DUF4252 domain-containing protein [Acidobacteria bacterium]|nr:DUF4252 domain-containing protein [Acidobacteriota bacterium]
MRKNMKLKPILFATFLGVLGLSAQELDLGFLKGLESKAKEATEINLGPEQIQLMMGFSGEASKELLGLGKSIERVQVKVLEFDKDGMYSVADMEALKTKLRSSEFSPLISHKEKGGFTEIVMRKGPKGNRGFVILSAEAREVTIVNIVGELDLASLGKLTGKFGIPNIQMGPTGKSGKGSNKDEDEI